MLRDVGRLTANDSTVLFIILLSPATATANGAVRSTDGTYSAYIYGEDMLMD